MSVINSIIQALINAKVCVDQNDIHAASQSIDWAIDELKDLAVQEEQEKEDDNSDPDTTPQE
jgi:flagellin-specific chaperone FliS